MWHFPWFLFIKLDLQVNTTFPPLYCVGKLFETEEDKAIKVAPDKGGKNPAKESW